MFNFSDQLVKNIMRTYENTKKITAGQRTCCFFIDYPYFAETRNYSYRFKQARNI